MAEFGEFLLSTSSWAFNQSEGRRPWVSPQPPLESQPTREGSRRRPRRRPRSSHPSQAIVHGWDSWKRPRRSAEVIRPSLGTKQAAFSKSETPQIYHKSLTSCLVLIRYETSFEPSAFLLSAPPAPAKDLCIMRLVYRNETLKYKEESEVETDDD